jgi:hypothetical protein
VNDSALRARNWRTVWGAPIAMAALMRPTTRKDHERRLGNLLAEAREHGIERSSRCRNSTKGRAVRKHVRRPFIGEG